MHSSHDPNPAPCPIHPQPHRGLVGYLMQLPFVLLLTTGLLYGTLPSAILLWTEPDMDPDQERIS